MTEFVVNGEIRELRMMRNGVDISGDFVGNTVNGMGQDEQGRWIADEVEFDWWRQVVADHQELEQVIQAYKIVYDAEIVDRVVSDWMASDLDKALDSVVMGLTEVIGPI